ncbi:MAG: GNAT family N-acetyltransferase [Betaproteobacteria bacterium]|nr:GNAT family N-acetyltransferase [Betaproteobacteria bacterium]
MSFRCDTANEQDLPQLVELLGLLFAQEAEFAPDAAKQRAALALILADRGIGRVYVAREGGRVVAMASLLYTVSTAEGGKAAWLEDMVVLPELRGRGIGTRLAEHVIAQARAEGLARITLLTDADNAPAQRLYGRLGFRASPMRAMRLKLG